MRVGHGGTKSFEIFYRSKGKLRRESLGRWPEVSLAAARDAWRKTREAIVKGDDPTNREGTNNHALQFEHVVEEWLRRDQSKNKQSSFYQVSRSVEADLLPAWRGTRVDKLAKRDVIELLDSIADRGAPVMARRVQAYVNRFFAWCIERDILKVDPTQGMPRIGKATSRERVLTDHELASVWRGADSIGLFGSVVRLLVLTGMRREEATQLRWSEVHGDHVELSSNRVKNGESHIVSLSAPARKLLDSIPRIADSDFVFTVSGVRPISGWSRPKVDLDSASGVSDWRIHDLRRSLATGLQKLGFNLQVVECVLGHTSGSRGGIVGVYQRHNFAAEKAAALEAWGAHVMSLTNQ